MNFWEVFATSSVVAAGVTIGVNRFLKWQDDNALRSAIKQAIQAEIDFASDFGIAYLEPGSVKAPLHRITTALYSEGVPKLIALGAINYECSQALLQYYGNIDQMNRSLDLILSLREPEEKQEEIERTLIKACSLVSIRDLRRLADIPRANTIEKRVISDKSAKYGDVAPYDRVKRAMGLL
jgi:hypothetical protein